MEQGPKAFIRPAMNKADIRQALEKIGRMVPDHASLVLIGGSALSLLGSPRATLDLDFVGDDLSTADLHKLIIRLAANLEIPVEPVPLERFIPLPEGSERRKIHIGRFGNLEVFVADPYSIALSKLDRGFDTDLEDIIFLLRKGLIDIKELDRMSRESFIRATEFDLDPKQMLARLKMVRDRS